MAETPLARAARLMLMRPEDDAARLRFYEVLSGAELVLLLAQEGEGEAVEPETLEAGGLPHVVAYDSVAAFARGEPRPTATLSGHALAQMLAGQGAGAALHMEGFADPLLVPPESLEWLAENLAHGPQRVEARPVSLRPPTGLPTTFLAALDRRLAQAEGLARAAWLAAIEWSDGSSGHLLAFVGARAGAEEALATGINAAVALSGTEGVRLDVTFLSEGDAVIGRLEKVALRFDLEDPTEAPTGPPRLR